LAGVGDACRRVEGAGAGFDAAREDPHQAIDPEPLPRVFPAALGLKAAAQVPVGIGERAARRPSLTASCAPGTAPLSCTNSTCAGPRLGATPRAEGEGV
jgi:hypothetical protein